MDTRLVDLALAADGVFGAAAAARVGLTARDLSEAARRGEIVRVRRGAYVLGVSHRSSDPESRYRLSVRAVLATRPEGDRASHHAALALWGLPLVDVNFRRIDIASDVASRNVGNGVYVYPPIPGDVPTSVDGVRTTAVATALVQTAVRSCFLAGVVAMDQALHRGLCDLAGLGGATALLPRRRRGRAETAIARADPRCESVGETRTRLLLEGLGLAYRSQVEIRDTAGRFVARVDFLVGDVVVEFDGLVKYDGITGRQALADEKARESRLRDLGYEVVRIVWSELADPASVARRIRAAQTRAATNPGLTRVG